MMSELTISQVGMPGLGWEKAEEKISNGDQRIIFGNFPQLSKGPLFLHKKDILIL